MSNTHGGLARNFLFATIKIIVCSEPNTRPMRFQGGYRKADVSIVPIEPSRIEDFVEWAVDNIRRVVEVWRRNL